MVGADGTILSQTEHRTDARRGPAMVITTLQHAINEIASPASLTAVGIACAGQIHPATGVVVEAPNLGWRDVPLGAALREVLGVPVIVENDVRAAAWGEFSVGAGASVRSLIAVFVGTGVGSGAVLDGRLWRGAGNAAGEIGHTQVVPDGVPCPCGRTGCLERYASGSGFQQRFRLALAEGVASQLGEMTGDEPERLTSAMVFAAARGGDPLAGALWEDAERYLTIAVANYVTLVNPDALVLGGGVLESTPTLFDRVAAGVLRLTTTMARDTLTVVRPRLGDWSGVVGAAALASSPAA